MRTLIKALAVIVLVLSGALASSDRVLADTFGSYTFTYDGVAPVDTSVRITAVGLNKTMMDFILHIDGLTKEQATNALVMALAPHTISMNGPNSRRHRERILNTQCQRRPTSTGFSHKSITVARCLQRSVAGSFVSCASR